MARMTPDLSFSYLMSGLQYLERFGLCGVFSSISVTFDSTSNALFQMSGKGSKDDLDDLVNSIENVSVGQEKKKKKKNKKKKEEGGEEAADTEEKSAAVENGASENNGLESTAEDSASSKKKKSNKKKKGAAVQTDPPTVPVKDLFPSGQFPEGQIMEHPIAQSDTTAKNR